MVGLNSTSVEVRNLWVHQDLGGLGDEFTAEVEAHGVVMETLTGK